MFEIEDIYDKRAALVKKHSSKTDLLLKLSQKVRNWDIKAAPVFSGNATSVEVWLNGKTNEAMFVVFEKKSYKGWMPVSFKEISFGEINIEMPGIGTVRDIEQVMGRAA